MLITSAVELWLYKRLNILRKGCYLLKNVNVPSVSKTVYDGFLKDGFDLYCQEQESSILFGEFSSHLNIRSIEKDQFLPFKGVFCLGKRETLEYKKFFESKKDIFFDVGSVRLELWKKKYAAQYQDKALPTAKPYILVVSNFGYVMGEKHWSALSLIYRSLEMFKSYSQEEEFLKCVAEDCDICCEMILAVKHLARKNPKHDIVFRPHPTDSRSNWENIFCDDENVSVTGNSDSISSWIHNASLIIQNGCTSAFEAVIREVPVISYGPDRIYDDITIPNMLGIRAHNLQELDQSLEIILKKDSYEEYQKNSENVIDPLVSMNKESAALEIIKIMERESCELLPGEISGSDVLSIRVVKFLKKNVDLVRGIFGVDGLKDTILEPLDKMQVQKDVKFMSEVLDLPEPKVTWVSKTCLLLG